MVTLVCGLANEAPIEQLIVSLKKRRSDFLLLDQEHLADQVQLRWQVTDSGITGHLKVEDRAIDISEIRSVYHRFVDPGDVLGCGSSISTVGKTRSIMRSLMDLFDILPTRVVNRRRPMMSNNSKPYQALLIKQSGFATPETMITNDSRSLMDFASEKGSLIYKSISSIRSIVAPFNAESVAKLESLPLLPTQFQCKVEGFNVRVHAIGRRLFATKILSSATDYRYAIQESTTADFIPYELTEALREKCLHLMQIFQLSFAGIDLIVSPKQVYCLEVNPSPAFSFYEAITGQPISRALASYLSYK